MEIADDPWVRCSKQFEDPVFFAPAAVDHGTVIWPNGLDNDPLVIDGDFEAISTDRGVG